MSSTAPEAMPEAMPEAIARAPVDGGAASSTSSQHQQQHQHRANADGIHAGARPSAEDSLKKGGVQSKEADVEAKAPLADGDVVSETESQSKIKVWMARHKKQTRVGVHIAIGVVMTG